MAGRFDVELASGSGQRSYSIPDCVSSIEQFQKLIQNCLDSETYLAPVSCTLAFASCPTLSTMKLNVSTDKHYQLSSFIDTGSLSNGYNMSAPRVQSLLLPPHPENKFSILQTQQ